ncbi:MULTISPECIES: DoxX family protein [Streptacidiphilus]|uniref:DoxX family protein n=1 Tax=Streptacidiphilus cavernicola TaxID=3342716 RepID=A0ABV6UNL3_9ACTN|nr:DoxX family protein [Streptacidiphilus jeojiense]
MASADYGLLILRITLFAVMGFHGTQKLFGWWDGGGLDRAEKFFASQGFRPPRMMALIAGATETTGALLVGAGAGSVLAVAMLTGVLANVAAIHLRNGLDSRKHGFELELALLAAVAAIGFCGPGALSLDHLLALPHGAPWGPLAVAAGVLAGLVVVTTRTPVGERPAAAPAKVPSHRP